jgi:hypothetical protein
LKPLLTKRLRRAYLHHSYSTDLAVFLDTISRTARRVHIGAAFKQELHDTIAEVLSQRIYGLVLGYEDINDHEQLRTDPVFGISIGPTTISPSRKRQLVVSSSRTRRPLRILFLSPWMVF